MRLALALALALGGCSFDVCQSRASVAESCGLGFSDTRLDECRQAQDTCSHEERVEMKKLYECLVAQGYEDCSNGTTTTGTTLDQVLALGACEEDATNISDSCLAALGAGMSTTFTLEP